MNTTQNKNLQIALLVFISFVDLLGFSMVVAIFPPIVLHNSAHLIAANASEEFRNNILGLIIASFPLFQFISSPFFGQLSDAWGRKKMMMLSCAGSALAFILSAWALHLSSLVLLIVSRAFAGFFAGNITLVQAALGDLSTPATRVRNFSLLISAMSGAYIVGPFLGGHLSDPHWFQGLTLSSPFYFSACCFALICVLIHVMFPETQPPKPSHARINLSDCFGEIWQIKSMPEFKLPLLAFFIIRTGFWIFVFFFGAYLIKKFGLSKGDVANAYMAIACLNLLIVNTVVKWSQKFLSLRHNILMTGLVLVVGTLLIGLLSQVRLIYWVFPFWAFGATGFYTYFLAYLSKQAGKAKQGVVIGIAMSVQNLAQIVSPLFAGSIMIHHASLPLVMAAVFVMVGIGCLGWHFQHETDSSSDSFKGG